MSVTVCIWPRKAPETFQRLMETSLGELQFNLCFTYLNKIIVFSKTQKEHLTQLRTLFQKLKEQRLKLMLSKVKFFKKSLTYLGHKILEKEIEADDHKIKVIWYWSTSKTVTEVRSF